MGTQKTIILSPDAVDFAAQYSKNTGRTFSGFIDWLIRRFKNADKDVFER